MKTERAGDILQRRRGKEGGGGGGAWVGGSESPLPEEEVFIM